MKIYLITLIMEAFLISLCIYQCYKKKEKKKKHFKKSN